MPIRRQITEDYLCQLGRCSKLSDIQSLDLSNHDLETIDADLFNQLTSLQSLDLSRNKLMDLPEKLSLKKLSTLDLLENQIKSTTFVVNFPKLHRLFLDRNPDLESEDRYIAGVLAPSLNEVDDYDNLKLTEKLYRDILESQIKAAFDALHGEVYSSGIPDSEFYHLQKDFTQTLQRNPLIGSNLTMPKFKRFMIQHLAYEYLMSIKKGRSDTNKRRTSLTPGKDDIKSPRYGTRISSGAYVAKDYSSGTPVEKMDADIAPSSQRKLSEKKTPESSKSMPHRGQKRARETPWKEKPSKQCHQDSPSFTQIKSRDQYSRVQLPPLPDYDPVQFIRCHSHDNNPSDDETKVWMCAFQPDPRKPGETTNIVATCGGKIVCFIDCQTGRVMKRYKDNHKDESFFCLAWTTIPADGESLKEDVSILAVAGNNGLIKLFQPSQRVMFATMEGHRSYISCLTFHPEEPTQLFSGSRDGRIILWDIGMPDFTDYTTKYRQLLVLKAPGTDAVNLSVSLSCDLLIAGCDKSCYAWRLSKLTGKARDPDLEFLHPQEKAVLQDEDVVVDGLLLLSNNCIASKQVGQSCLYLWDLKQHIPDHYKSRTQVVPIIPLALLDYTLLDVDYVYPGASQGGVVCVGDADGKLYMYDVATLLKKKTQRDKILIPSRVLPWPELTLKNNIEDMQDILKKKKVVLNCVAVSSDSKFVVTGTDNNLVCIWKRT
ncbi:hypothetical protein CHS0354_013108 [Potamilus streckersoni]|uniref:Leucine-rich repeat and WD repeat-containing protein 1 n=1 Tax=Potamilus streckersoni TaxID=2493646 RepID=A0AAE0S731_9BIVA|nr:hypothetical protein CHS0354_013108 [Potamilus streckersoni]